MSLSLSLPLSLFHSKQFSTTSHMLYLSALSAHAAEIGGTQTAQHKLQTPGGLAAVKAHCAPGVRGNESLKQVTEPSEFQRRSIEELILQTLISSQVKISRLHRSLRARQCTHLLLRRL